MFKFLGRFELFKKGHDPERYGEFMRRWESNRADFEACRDFDGLLKMLSERLDEGEQATIRTGHYLTITGPYFEYMTRVYIREGK